jgi:hypothetical protein
VVLLVLAIVWGILLVSWLRSRAEGTFSDSVGTFRRHLSVLEKAAPYRVAPANRLRGPAPIPAFRAPAAIRGERIGAARSAVSPSRPLAGSHPLAGSSRPLAGASRSGAGSSHPLAGPSRSGAGSSRSGAGPSRGPVTAVALRRRQSQKRRRDVFFALLAGVVGSFLIAIIPGLSVMWPVQVLFDVMFVAYVAVLIHLRNVAAERDLKLRFMPPAPRAARPKPSYDFGGSGYGDLDLRRAAN